MKVILVRTPPQDSGRGSPRVTIPGTKKYSAARFGDLMKGQMSLEDQGLRPLTSRVSLDYSYTNENSQHSNKSSSLIT